MLKTTFWHLKRVVASLQEGRGPLKRICQLICIYIWTFLSLCLYIEHPFHIVCSLEDVLTCQKFFKREREVTNSFITQEI